MVLTFVNVAGQSVPPMIIHKGQWVQDTWHLKAPRSMTIVATEKGYIMKSRFHQYGLAFIKYLKANRLADKTNLLILDGHKSHLYNLPFYEAMRANDVEILTILPHTSHIIQPLNSVPFTQFKKSWENHLMKYNTSHSGRTLNKVNFWNVFVPAWNSSMCPKNIIAGFRKTGIHPFNPQVIPAESLAPSLVTDRELAGNGEACWCWDFFPIFYVMEHFHLLDNLKWSFLFPFLQREKRMGVTCNWMYCVAWSQCHFRFYFVFLRAACGCLHVYKFYPVLNHVACISARSVAASVASAVTGQSPAPASSVSIPRQPRQPPTKPISSDVQATHKKRPVEEKEDEPPAKWCIISIQGRSIVSVNWLFQQLCIHSILIFYLFHVRLKRQS